jgi:hypothetical protein
LSVPPDTTSNPRAIRPSASTRAFRDHFLRVILEGRLGRLAQRHRQRGGVVHVRSALQAGNTARSIA